MAKDIKFYIEQLKEYDIRMTTQRLAILEYLAIDGNHPTANDIYKALKTDFPNMSFATVYNNLNFFMEAGILQELPFGDDSSRYDLTESKHYHAICDNCGKVIDFNYPGLEGIENFVAQHSDFRVDDHNLKVTGLCKECQL